MKSFCFQFIVINILILLLNVITVTDAQSPEDRARKLLAQMSIDEKLTMVHGAGGAYVGNVPANTRLGIPAIKMNDGPQGFRDNAHPGTTTQWPSCLTVTASFDPNLFLQWGTAMGAEFAGKGSNVQLGPGVNVARVPVNGRNFEYLSGEDPYLGAQMVRQIVTGIQSQGVIANAKHYIHNNQETNRGSVSATVDERTRMEIYMPPFEAAVEAGLLSIMCSYNKVNGIYSCENSETLNKDLKGYVNFSGWVMSDWGATHSTVASANGGLDQEMPDGAFFGAALKTAIQNGQVPLSRLNDMVFRILVALYKIGEFDNPVKGNIAADVTSPAHNALARSLAAQSTVLLKNKGGVLPLPKKGLKQIAVFNPSASQAIITGGGGSGSVVPKYQVSPLAGIMEAVNGGSPRAQCVLDPPNFDLYQPGNPSAPSSGAGDCCKQCQARLDCNAWTYYSGTCYFKYDASGYTPKQGCQSGTIPVVNGTTAVKYYYGTDTNAAVALAQASDVAICVLATSSSEGSDRRNLQLNPSEIQICQAVAKVRNTVAVIITPGAVLTDWTNDVASIVVGFMPGQEEGHALADVLFGDVNPGGKLPITFPNVENEVGFKADEYPGVNLVEYYREQLNVGYRWYKTNNVTPKFPFGFGLSYTTFSLSALSLTGRKVSVTLANIGTRVGTEVVQVYVQFPASAGEPPLQLKGFQKVSLNSGANQVVDFELTDRDLSIWDISSHSWKITPGTYTIFVGTSSASLPLKATLNV